jgi:hypothetical protein
MSGTLALGQPGSPHTCCALFVSHVGRDASCRRLKLVRARGFLVVLGMILDQSLACLRAPIRHGMVLEQISQPAASAGSPVASRAARSASRLHQLAVSSGGSESCLCKLEVAVSRHLPEKHKRPTDGGDVVRPKRLKFMFGLGKEFEKHRAFRRDNGLIRPSGELVMCTSLSSRPIPSMNNREEDLLHIIWLMFEKQGIVALSQLVFIIRACSLGPAVRGQG